ncbi:MAG: hypothetical protein J2O48_03665 [Solirubrobacterales bacterium]|nr:hypothetical protein [Solirubrobacterales bacterium]
MPQTLTTAGTKAAASSTPVIDGNALWHIIVVSAAAGAGLALCFGLILLGVKFFQEGQAGQKLSGYALSAVSGVVAVAAIAGGIYMMTNPKSSKPTKVKDAQGKVISTTASPILKTKS